MNPLITCLVVLVASPFMAQTRPAVEDAGATQAISSAASASGDASVSGHVTDATSSPVSAYSVIVFATDRRLWVANSRFLRLAQPTQDGSFEVSDLPPGEYFVAATDPQSGEASAEWHTTNLLDQLSFRATRVTLAEKQRFVTVLRLIRR